MGICSPHNKRPVNLVRITQTYTQIHCGASGLANPERTVSKREHCSARDLAIAELLTVSGKSQLLQSILL
jgi:hypothetical protein